MKTRRLTVAQALITFLQKQYTERDGIEHELFAGCFGIFGHGNIAGIGQALFQDPNFKYYQILLYEDGEKLEKYTFNDQPFKSF